MSFFRKFFGKQKGVLSTIQKILQGLREFIIISTLNGLIVYPQNIDDESIHKLISKARDKLLRITNDIRNNCRILIIDKEDKAILGFDYGLLFICLTENFEHGKRLLCKVMDKIGDVIL